MGTVIQVQNLNLYYGEKQVLSKINLALPQGEVLALIGPASSGKSSFLRTLNRLHDPVENARIEGSISLFGKNIYSPETDVLQLRKRVGMIFSRPNPFPMSIFDNIAYGPRIHGLQEDRALNKIVEDSLKRVGLWAEVRGRLERPALDLTLGQQQRLCLGRLLAVGSEILLLDDPCRTLDPISTTRLEDLLHQLKADHTIIIATRSLQQAGRIADRTAFFLAGELVEEGPTEKIFQRPADSRTEDYLTGRFG